MSAPNLIPFKVEGRLLLDGLSEDDVELVLDRVSDALMLGKGFIDPSMSGNLCTGEWEFTGFMSDALDESMRSMTLDRFQTEFGL